MNGKFIRTNTKLFPYNRKAALNYAKRWALDRNPKYYDFENIGGDCTNYASQVLHAGGCPMNTTKWTGWYYYDVNNRAPAWTSVEHLYEFLKNNEDRGPIAKASNIEEVQVGDLVQIDFGYKEVFAHTPVIVKIDEPRNPSNIYIAAHTYDRYMYPLSNYEFVMI